MITVLLATKDEPSFSGLASTLEQEKDLKLFWAESGQNALKILSSTTIDLVITDEHLKDMTGLELAEKIVAVNPMINCAAVSALPAEEFHEVSEGLGLLDQLPPKPGPKESEGLLKTIKAIKKQLSGLSPS